MKTQVNKTALLTLQWMIAVVLFIEAAWLAFSRTEIHFAGHPGIHHWIRLALAWSEMLACLVFLVPRSRKRGAALLVIVLTLATLVHVLHANFQIGGLFIYVAAVSVVASQSHS
jgi:uncharacterized membrane protein YphA (DoxX/SURF4 family)